MNRSALSLVLIVLGAAALSACKKKAEPVAAPDQHATSGAPAPTNRVDIPAAVRKNLGITFARVETRNVARTLRVPGRFELLPTARREHRAAMPGRVEILVTQFQRVEVGTALYRLDAPRWRELQEQIAASEGALEQAEARAASIGPLREAQTQRTESLTARATLLAERVGRLEELQSSGAGSRKDLDETKGALSQARAELAEVTERRAELESKERELQAERRSLRSRVSLLLGTAASIAGMSGEEMRQSVTTDGTAQPRWQAMSAIEIRCTTGGVVETIGATPGSMVEEGALVVSTVQPEQLRFHAKGLQADLGTLKDGLAARVVPPGGGSIALQESMEGRLAMGLGADPDERTIDLFLTPERLAGWGRNGVSGYLEVVLEGGDAELAIPLACVTRDGTRSIIFRRDPTNPDKAIRMDADLGLNDGRWVVIGSGVKEGDEIIVDGVYQLMLATAGNAPKGGHFHSDGTFHEGEDK